MFSHHSIGNDPRVYGLEVDDANEFAKTVFACPLSAGDAVLHLPTTLHHAGPNTTPRQRRTYIVAMIASSEPRAIPVTTIGCVKSGQRAKSMRVVAE